MTEKSTSRKITQELDRLHKSLTTQLERFYKQNIKGSQLPPEELKQKYGKEVEDIIRKTVQSSWLFAGIIIQDEIGETVFITGKDGNGMGKTTNDMVNQFWTTSGKIWLRENEYKYTIDNKLVQLDQFDLHAGMVGIGLLVAYYAYNQSMFSKSEELTTKVKLKFVTRENCIDSVICLPLSGNLYNVGEVPFTLPLHRHCKCRLIPIRV